MTPTFSVLVSSYNYQKYVVETLESVLGQTLAPKEIVVVDDGSTDDSVAILRQRFGTSPSVRIIEKTNGGQLSAWITGLKLLTGDIVAFMDSDDLWKPNYLEELAKLYQSDTGIDFVFCNMELFGSRNGVMHPSSRSRDLGLSVLMGAFVNRWQGSATSALSLKRRWAEQLLNLPEVLAAEWKSRPDDCLVCGADILGARKYYLGAALVKHREHASNALLGYKADAIKNMRYAMRNERMLEHYRQIAGITPRWARLAKAEFKTKKSPLWSEFTAYSGLLWRSPLGLIQRSEHQFSMIGHLIKSRAINLYG